MNKPLKIMLVSVAVTQVMGCASLELLAVGGVSYLITGKGLSDHALSLTMDKDCAFHRVLTQGSICQDELPEEINTDVMLARNEADSAIEPHDTASDIEAVATDSTNPKVEAAMIAANYDIPPDDSVALDEETLTSGIASVDELRNVELPQEVVSEAQVYAVVGSFNDLKYAFERSMLYRIYNTQIIETPRGSNTRYRVVVGPLDDRDLIEHIPNKVAKNSQPHWAIELCEDSLMPPPCGGQFLVKN